MPDVDVAEPEKRSRDDGFISFECGGSLIASISISPARRVSG